MSSVNNYMNGIYDNILTVMTGEKRRWKCACGGRAVSVKILRNQALKEKHMRNKEERRKRK